MASSTEFIDFVCSQIADAGMVRAKKMFGDHCIYVDEKPALLVCDNIVYIKKHDAIAQLMTDAECGFPYDGAKEHYILDIDHRKEAVNVIAILLPHLPYPKPKKKNNIMKKILTFALAAMIAFCSCSTQKADFAALTAAADSCYMAGDYVGASDYYEQALRCEETQPYNYFNAACCAAKAEEYDKAFERLNAILKKYPDWYSRDIEKDQDLSALHSDVRWKPFVQEVVARKERIESGYEHPLYDQLMAIMEEDQTIRNAYMQAYYAEDPSQDSLLRLMLRTDTMHMQFVDSVIATRGWVGQKEVGDGVIGIWFVVQHYGGEKWIEYLPVFKEAVAKGDLDQYHVDATEMYIQEFLKNDNE